MPRIDWVTLFAIAAFMLAAIGMFALLAEAHGCAEILGTC